MLRLNRMLGDWQRVDRRTWLAALGAAVGGAVGLGASDAEASLARALPVGRLLLLSRAVVLATPTDRVCRWESVGGRERIVSVTRVSVEERLVGTLEDGADVLTLGGQIGKLGHRVFGEATLRVGERCLLFLGDVQLDAGPRLRPSGFAQGHYPIRRDAQGVPRLALGPEHAGVRVGAGADAAVRQLPNRRLGELAELLRKARAR